MKFRMDKTLRFWVDCSYEDKRHENANRTRAELIAEILGEYERRQQFGDPARGMIGQSGEHIGYPWKPMRRTPMNVRKRLRFPGRKFVDVDYRCDQCGAEVLRTVLRGR